MVICPRCNTQYPDGTEFCELDGAPLASTGAIGDSLSGAGSSDGTATVPASETDDLKRAHAELKKRDERIAELEEELRAARGKAPNAGDTKGGKPSAPVKRPPSLPDTQTVATPRPFLVWVGGRRAGERFEITANGLEIGRKAKYAKAGGIAIDDGHVSNPHAWIGVRAGKIILRDESSTNGTFLNDQKIQKEVTVKPNDVITIANHDVAKFKLEVSG